MVLAVPRCRSPGGSRASQVEPVGCPSKKDFFHPKANPRMERGKDVGGKRDELNLVREKK